MVRTLVALFVICQLIFAIWPPIDIYVSEMFYSQDKGFWLRESRFLEHIRMGIVVVFGIGLVAVLVGLLVLIGRAGVHLAKMRRAFEVVALAYALGAGVLVNSILKSYWGRARPSEVQEFGGDRLFTPPFQISNQCPTNCSFVSGEGAAVTVFFFGICLITWVISEGLQRWTNLAKGLISSSGAVAILGLSLRVLTGRHFLSDTLFAVLLMAFTYVAILHLPRYRALAPIFYWNR